MTTWYYDSPAVQEVLDTAVGAPIRVTQGSSTELIQRGFDANHYAGNKIYNCVSHHNQRSGFYVGDLVWGGDPTPASYQVIHRPHPTPDLRRQGEYDTIARGMRLTRPMPPLLGPYRPRLKATRYRRWVEPIRVRDARFLREAHAELEALLA